MESGISDQHKTLLTICKFIPIYVQQDAPLHSLFMYGNCSTCFGWYLHPSSGVHTTVSTVSGICHTVAVDKVVCAPDDGWRYHPKHVEQLPDINKLCKGASCWIYIGIYLWCTDPWTLNLSVPRKSAKGKPYCSPTLIGCKSQPDHPQLEGGGGQKNSVASPLLSKPPNFSFHSLPSQSWELRSFSLQNQIFVNFVWHLYFKLTNSLFCCNTDQHLHCYSTSPNQHLHCYSTSLNKHLHCYSTSPNKHLHCYSTSPNQHLHCYSTSPNKHLHCYSTSPNQHLHCYGTSPNHSCLSGPKLQNVAYHWASRCILFDHSLTSRWKLTFPNAQARKLDPSCLMKPAEETFQRARWWGTHTWSPLKRKLTRFNNKWWERCHTGHSNKITVGCWYRSDG